MLKMRSVNDAGHDSKIMEFFKEQDKQRREFQKNIIEEMNLAPERKLPKKTGKISRGA